MNPNKDYRSLRHSQVRNFKAVEKNTDSGTRNYYVLISDHIPRPDALPTAPQSRLAAPWDRQGRVSKPRWPSGHVTPDRSDVIGYVGTGSIKLLRSDGILSGKWDSVNGLRSDVILSGERASVSQVRYDVIQSGRGDALNILSHDWIYTIP